MTEHVKILKCHQKRLSKTLIKEAPATHALLGPYGIIQYLQTTPISQTNFFTGTFFATSYSKAALDFSSETVFRNG